MPMLFPLKEAGIEVKGGNSLSSSPTSAQRLNLEIELPYLESFNFAKMSDTQRRQIFDAITQNGGPLNKEATTNAVINVVAGWRSKDVFYGEMPSSLREKPAPDPAPYKAPADDFKKNFSKNTAKPESFQDKLKSEPTVGYLETKPRTWSHLAYGSWQPVCIRFSS